MKEPHIKRDWEMARIFLILAVLTAGFVFALQSLILTPVTIGRIPGYKNLPSTPLGRGLHKDAVRANVFDTFEDAESLFSPEAQPLEPSPSSDSIDRSTSSEEKDWHSPQAAPLRESSRR